MAEGKVADGWYQFDNDINSVIDGIAGNGVISGLTQVEDSPADMSVVIAAGSYVANGTEVTKGSEIDVTIEAADGSNPRKDIIIADSAGNITVVKGTAATAVPSGQTGPNTSTPVPGNITANKIILAEVWVGAGVTTILDANITDRRIIALGITSAAGILSFPKQPAAKAYRDEPDQTIPTATWVSPLFNAEAFDVGNDFDITSLAVTADGNTLNHLIDSSEDFPTLGVLVGWFVWNTAADLYARVTAVADGDLTLDFDAFPNGNEAGLVYASRFTAPVDGKYLVPLGLYLIDLDDGDALQWSVKVNDTSQAYSAVYASGAAQHMLATATIALDLNANDYVTIECYHNEGADQVLNAGVPNTHFGVIKAT